MDGANDDAAELRGDERLSGLAVTAPEGYIAPQAGRSEKGGPICF
jgi:hypothetical protein